MPDDDFSFIDTKKAILQKLNHPVPLQNGVDVDVLRLDLIHPVISGNKWFKLKNYLSKALKEHKTGIATFGGPWSNHIAATAYACKEIGLRSVGFIRGEKPAKLSRTLEDAADAGMQLIYIPRALYKLRNSVLEMFADVVADMFIVPEGGCGQDGIDGASDINSLLPEAKHHYIACAVGTGTMLKGLMQNNDGVQQYIGISSLKLANTNEGELVEFLCTTKFENVRLLNDYHFGGYGKTTSALIDFMNELYTLSSIPTDIVYTAKLFYGIVDMIENQKIPEGASVCLIHSGGLQGNRSLPGGTLCY